MNWSQRIVLVVAAGAIAAVLANTLNTLLDQPDGGWFMYAPNSSVLTSESVDDWSTVRAAAVWVAAIGAWLGVSCLVLRNPSPRD